MRLLAISIFYVSLCCSSLAAVAGELKIHAINVGWGQSVLIEGPNGTTLLIDAGLAKKKEVVINYLKNRGIAQLDYFMLSHNHADHGGAAEFVVRALRPKKTFYSGSEDNMSAVFMKSWFSSYKEVSMPAPVAMPLGHKIDLGDGASATAVAVDCEVVHQAEVVAKLRQTQPDYVMPPCSSANDASIVVLVKYKGFDYLVSGDLGGNAHNGQSDFETPVITALLLASEPELRTPLRGVDVLHLGHHGSRTSTNQTYLDLAGPEVALVSVGPNQSHGLPNVEAIQPMLDKGIKVLQTDEGKLSDSRMFNGGNVVGHITISTDGSRFTVDADASGIDTVSQPQVVSEAKKAGLPFTALVDGGGTVPTPDTATPTAIATIAGSGVSMNLQAKVSDDIGVTRIDFLIDGIIVASQTPTTPLRTGSVEQTYDGSKLKSGPHTLQVKVVDAAGKSALSAAIPFSIGSPVNLEQAEQEANDSRSTANVVLSTTRTVVGYFPSSSDNQDWYAFSLAPGAKLTLTMTGPSASAQDYDLSLHSSTGTVLAKSEGSGTTENISYTNGNSTRTVYLRVSRVSSSSRTTPYRIELK